jgi:hypothetical protein
MLPNHQYSVTQRQPLLWIIRNRRVHRSMSNRNTCRRRNHPPNMLIGLVPHLDPKGEVAGNVVQVGIGQLPQKFIDPEVPSELAPQRPFDASRSCSSTLSVCS